MCGGCTSSPVAALPLSARSLKGLKARSSGSSSIRRRWISVLVSSVCDTQRKRQRALSDDASIRESLSAMMRLSAIRGGSESLTHVELVAASTCLDDIRTTPVHRPLNPARQRGAFEGVGHQCVTNIRESKVSRTLYPGLLRPMLRTEMGSVWPSFIRFCRKAREGPRPAVLGAASAAKRRASHKCREGGPLVVYEGRCRQVGPRNTDGVGQGLVPPGQERGGSQEKREGWKVAGCMYAGMCTEEPYDPPSNPVLEVLT